MASKSAATLAEEFLVSIEKDIAAHQNKTAPSVYAFGGVLNGSPVGISKTAQVSLNRGGQILQFLAGYFTSTTNTTTKSRIAKAAAQVYNVFAQRLVCTAIDPVATTKPDIEVNGQFGNDPSGATFLVGLMMIDKQGVTAHSSFTGNSIHSQAYVRDTMIKRIARKANQAIVNDTGTLNTLLSGANYVWVNQKMAKEALNGTSMNIAAISLYGKMYGETAYNTAYTNSYNLHRLVATKYGSTFSGTSTTPIEVTTAGSNAGTNLSLAIGGNDQGRGAFPSIGYNSFVAMGMMLQALAEKATTSTTFTNFQSLVSGHVLHTDALKILNYYRDRVNADSFIYELGAHRNAGLDASRFRTDWKKALVAQGYTEAYAEQTLTLANSGFDALLVKSAYPGQAGYAYGLMWVMPTHTLFSNIASKYAYGTSGKTYLDVDYSKVGSSAPVAQALAATGEAAAVRIIAGIGIGLINGLTTVQ